MEINIMDIFNLLLSAIGIFLGGKALHNQKTYIQNSSVNNLCENAQNVTINQNMNCDEDKINEISQGVAQKEIQSAKENFALKWEEIGVEDGVLTIPNPFDEK